MPRVPKATPKVSDSLPWLIYVRVSTEEQTLGHSIQSQLSSCRAYAAHRGYVVGEEIVDAGMSAKNLNRPGIAKVMAALRDGTVRGCIAWRLDRVSRSVRDTQEIVDAVNEGGTELASVTEQLDTATPIGKFLLNFLASLAQWERETIASRVQMAKAYGAAQGWYTGGPVPAGMLVKRDGPHPVLVPDESCRAVVAQAWDWVLAGASLREVAQRFADAGVRRRGRRDWNPANVHDLLTSQQVTGKLVTAEKQQAVAAALKARDAFRASIAEAKRHNKPGHRAKRFSILTGLLRCPKCGGAMVAVTATGHGGTYPYYRCCLKVKRGCAQKDIRAEPVEAQAMRVVRQAVQSGAYADALRDELGRAREQLGAARLEVGRLEAERDALTARAAELGSMLDLPPKALAQALRGVGERLDAVTARLAELAGTVASASIDNRDLEEALACVRAGAEALGTKASPEDQATWLRSMISTIRPGDEFMDVDLYHPSSARRRGDTRQPLPAPRSGDGAAGSYTSTEWWGVADDIRTVKIRVSSEGIARPLPPPLPSGPGAPSAPRRPSSPPTPARLPS
jgi:site-specific DNA recombinase